MGGGRALSVLIPLSLFLTFSCARALSFLSISCACASLFPLSCPVCHSLTLSLSALSRSLALSLSRSLALLLSQSLPNSLVSLALSLSLHSELSILLYFPSFSPPALTLFERFGKQTALHSSEGSRFQEMVVYTRCSAIQLSNEYPKLTPVDTKFRNTQSSSFTHYTLQCGSRPRTPWQRWRNDVLWFEETNTGNRWILRANQWCAVHMLQEWRVPSRTHRLCYAISLSTGKLPI